MASAGVMRRLGQPPTGISSSTQQQRASLKRRRPYHDEERPLPPRRPRDAAGAAEPRRQEEGGNRDSDGEDALEEGGGGCDGGGGDDDDSEYEEDADSSDEDEALAAKRKKQQRRASPSPSPAPATMPCNGSSSGKASKQQQQTPKAGGSSPRAGGAGGGRGGGAEGGGRGREHKCLVCRKVFGKACKLARHAATHTGEKPFRCEEDGCSKAFATKDKLKRHALSHARRKAGLSVSVGDAARREAEARKRAARFEASAATAGVSLEPPAEPSPYLLYTAAPAVKVPPSLVEASRMERERAGAAAAAGDGGGSGGGTGGGWKHSCPTCGRNFLDNYHLKRHIKAIHEGPRPYKCDHPVLAAPAAGGAAATASAAAEGVALTVAAREGVVSGTKDGQREEMAAEVGLGQAAAAEGEKEAGRAGAGAATSGEVVVDKPQKAPHGVCGAAFAKKWQLREHLYAAHGQTKFNSRQHRCPRPGCGREFDRPSKLAAHEKTHKARFVCQFSGCGAAFVLASGLNLHLKEEHPFRCGVCDKIFDREDKMQIHQATHARAGDGGLIRPYACNAPGCGKSFTEKRNLNAHRRTRHTEGGRKRFRCEAGGCTMAFAHRHTLVKHIKREHKGPSSGSSPGVGDSGGGRTEAAADAANGKGDHGQREKRETSKASSGAPSQRRAPHSAEDPAVVTGAGDVGTGGPAEAKGNAERPAESPKERPAEKPMEQSDDSSVAPSPIARAPPAAEP